MHNDVLTFIKHFSSYGPGVINCFANGNCYWFAAILRDRFTKELPPHAPKVRCHIMYDEVINHFGCLIGDKIYDISGDVTDKYHWEDWDNVRLRDNKHAKRIRRDCIYLTNNGV